MHEEKVPVFSWIFTFIALAIPIVNVIYFIFSFYALKFSFKRQNKDIDSFLKSQKKWDIVGGVIFIIVITVYILFLGQHI